MGDYTVPVLLFVQNILFWAVSWSALLTAILWCVFKWRHRLLIANASKVTAAPGTCPIIGNLHQIAFHGIRGSYSRMDEIITECAKKNVKTLCFWVGPFPEIFVADPDDIKMVFTHSHILDKGFEIDLGRIIAGRGVFTAPGGHNKIVRIFMNPMFKPRNVRLISSVLNKTCRHLVEDLVTTVGCGLVNIQDIVSLRAFEASLYSIFGLGIEFDVKSTVFRNFHLAVERSSRVIFERFMTPWLLSDFLTNLIWKQKLKFMRQSIKEFVDMAQKMQRDRQILVEEEMLSSKGDANLFTDQYETLLDVYQKLKEIKSDITQQDFENEVLTLANGATDSTKVAVPSCLLALAANQDIQDKLYEEISQVVGTEHTDVTPEHLNAMPYLDQVFYETIRFFGTIPYGIRKTAKELKLKEITVPAGYSVITMLKGLNLNAETFAQPDKFDPGHFSPENKDKIKDKFFPFGGGSRNCVGKAYALQFVKTAIVHVLRRFRITTTVDISKLKYSVAVSAVSEDGYWMEFHERKPLNHQVHVYA